MRWHLHLGPLCQAESVRIAQRELDRFQAQSTEVGEVLARRTCQWKQGIQPTAHPRTVPTPQAAKALRKLGSTLFHFSLQPLAALSSSRWQKVPFEAETAWLSADTANVNTIGRFFGWRLFLTRPHRRALG
jgi:hypothetical protein